MRASGTPPVYIAGRGQDGGLQLHRGVVQPHPAPFWHPLSIPNRLRDADAQGNPNDLSDKPSTEPGQLHQTDITRRFEKDADAEGQLDKTVRLESVKQEDYDTVFYPGGHG